MIDKGQWWEFGQDTGVTPLLFTRSVMGFLMTTDSQDLGLTSHPKDGFPSNCNSRFSNRDGDKEAKLTDCSFKCITLFNALYWFKDKNYGKWQKKMQTYFLLYLWDFYCSVNFVDENDDEKYSSTYIFSVTKSQSLLWLRIWRFSWWAKTNIWW